MCTVQFYSLSTNTLAYSSHDNLTKISFIVMNHVRNSNYKENELPQASMTAVNSVK